MPAEGISTSEVFYKRLLESLHNGIKEIHLDGSTDFQRGFGEGYREAIRTVEWVASKLKDESA